MGLISMTLLGSIVKQTREIGDADISYVAYLAARTGVVTISSHTSEVFPAGLTIFSQLFDSNKVKVTFSGGTDGTLYKITVLATTSEGMVLEDEINVSVRNI